MGKCQGSSKAHLPSGHTLLGAERWRQARSSGGQSWQWVIGGLFSTSRQELSKQHCTHGAGRDEKAYDSKPIKAHVIHGCYPSSQARTVFDSAAAIDACELGNRRVSYCARNSFQGAQRAMA